MRKIILALAALLLIPSAGYAQSVPGLATVVSTCGTPPSTYTAGQNRPVLQNTSGQACTGATITPSGTQDVNLTKVNGAAVNVGTGAASTGTQRVTTSTDSTIGTLSTVTNPVPLGPSSVAGAGIIPVVSTALEACRVLKSGAGNLYALSALLTTTSGIVLAFDATSAPGDGAVTPVWFSVATSNGTTGGFSAGWPSNAPLHFAIGMTVCLSSATTPFTKTASATAAFSGGVQ